MATTGPYTRTQTNSSDTWHKNQTWYRQAAPYRSPLPYVMRTKTLKVLGNYWNMTGGSASSYGYDPLASTPALTAATNKAYAKFKDKCGETASLAVNVAERKQAMDMMSKRVSQLVRFTRALRRFRFDEAAEALGLSVVSHTSTSVRFKRTNLAKNTSWERAVEKQKHPPPLDPMAPVSGQMRRRPKYRRKDDSWELSFKRKASALGSNYLEFHFGWEPLMKDIENSFDLFTDPMRDRLGMWVRGASSATHTVPPDFAYMYSINTERYWKSSVSIRARVKISNLDLYQANQLGLLNPAVLLWELVPFSFIVDWFVNVGDFLSSFNDFWGLDFQDAQTAHLLYHTEKDRYTGYGPGGSTLTQWIRLYTHHCMQRTLGISTPIVTFRPRKAISVTRGATAISLLTGLLKTV